MRFDHDVPLIPVGLEPGRLILSGGRLCVQVAAHGGLSKVSYFGAQRFGDQHLYQSGDELSAWTQIFRPCAVVDGRLYYLEFADTRVTPFGYTSRCALAGVGFRHEIVLLNDALVHRLTILENPEGRTVAMALLHMDGASRVSRPTRAWSGFAWVEPGALFLSTAIDRHPPEPPSASTHPDNRFPHAEVERAETYVGVTASRPLRVEQPNHVEKHNLHTEPFAGSCEVTVVFGHSDRERFLDRARALRLGAAGEADARLRGYHERLATAPRVVIADPAAQSFSAHAGVLLDSVKVADIPGLLRGANSGAYWMWGWDSLIHSNAFGLAGDHRFIGDLLTFLRRHADPRLGIFHQIMINLEPRLAMHFSVQSLFGIALYDAWLFSGDLRLVDEHYAFAKSLADRSGADEVAGSGLVRGTGVYPDACSRLGQDGNDIAAINNSIYYQGLRALEALARALGRAGDAADFAARAERLRGNFERFYDPEKGFFYDSLSAADFSPRRHYCVHAVQWLTPFARDLVAGKEASICRFMATELRVRHGFRNMPPWDSAYMADGNNQGYYDPFLERFFREMMKAGRCGEGIRAFLEDLSWCWRQLSVPEALSAEAENNGFTLDCVGVMLPFSLKAWLSVLVNTVVGLDLDPGGLIFAPCDAPDLQIKNLVVRGCRIDLAVTGGGWDIARMTHNGREVKAPYRIPFADLAARNSIRIERGPVANPRD
jgi:hypothetical protein